MKVFNNPAEQIKRLLQWSDEEYGEFIYNCGIQYLHRYIKSESQAIVDHMVRSRIFWNWWKTHWNLRDRAFLDRKTVNLATSTWRTIYYELHDPNTLAAEIYPNGVVLGESYNTMIAELNKDALCQA